MHNKMIKPDIRIADENSEYADVLNITRDKLLIAERERDQLFLDLSQIGAVLAVFRSGLTDPLRSQCVAQLGIEETRSTEELKKAELEISARLGASEQLCQELTSQIDKIIYAQETQRVVAKYSGITNSELLYTYNRVWSEVPYEKTKGVFPDFLRSELFKVITYRADNKIVV